MSLLPCTLLVDDDTTTNFLNRLLIERMAVADVVLEARNGAEALRLLHTHCEQPTFPTCPALILLDLKMPVMDGFEFLEAFTQHLSAGAGTAVVIVLTTSLHPNDVRRIQALPIAGYLTKPLTKDKVESILAMHFGYQMPAA